MTLWCDSQWVCSLWTTMCFLKWKFPPLQRRPSFFGLEILQSSSFNRTFAATFTTRSMNAATVKWITEHSQWTGDSLTGRWQSIRLQADKCPWVCRSASNPLSRRWPSAQCSHQSVHAPCAAPHNNTQDSQSHDPSPLLDNIRVMVIVWRLRVSEWVCRVQHPTRHIIGHFRDDYQNSSVLDCVTQCSQSTAHLYEQFLQAQQIGFVTSGPYAVHRGGCLELYYCNMVEWFWWDSSLVSTTNWFPSVLWHCWFGHVASKNRSRNDL